MGNETIGPFIRRLRKERGMTQRELAGVLNVTDKAVSKWELGTSLPDVALLLPLAEALGVSATELLAGARLRERRNSRPGTRRGTSCPMPGGPPPSGGSGCGCGCSRGSAAASCSRRRCAGSATWR